MILNLTQHPATAEQTAAGVVNFEGSILNILKNILTFTEIPSRDEIIERANLIVGLARSTGIEAAMIGGAPYLMPVLEHALYKHGIMPLYSFTQRETVEKIGENGEVIKTAIFKHVGFIEAVKL
nr:MAG TPA: hypothetical protein [Caudoviricetes sp.]